MSGIIKGNKGGKGIQKGKTYMDPVQAAQLAEIQAKNHSQLLDELLPLVSQIINSNGGVMRIETIAMRANVKALLSRIQPPYVKTLPELLAEWTDFFHMMPAGLVGTNAGYDSGLILEDGSLNGDYIWKFVSPSESKDKSNVDDKLLNAADTLFHAIMDLSSEEPLLTTFNQLKQTRAILTGKAPVATIKLKSHASSGQVPLQSAEGADDALQLPPDQRQEWIILQIVHALRNQPNKSIPVSQIFSDAGPLKNGIFVKGKEFLERYPSLFSIHPSTDAGVDVVNPPLAVTLLDNGTDTIPTPLPQQYVSTWNGKGLSKRPKYN